MRFDLKSSMSSERVGKSTRQEATQSFAGQRVEELAFAGENPVNGHKL